MLFKIETAVWVVVGAVFLVLTTSQAQTVNTNGDMGSIITACKGSTDPNCVQNAINAQIQLNQAGKGKNNEDKCDDAMGKFHDAQSALGGACGPVGLPREPAACLKAMQNCSSKDDSSDDEKSSACPSAGADYKKYLDEAQKVQDDIDKLNEKKGKLSDKQAELTERANKQVQDVNKQAAKMQTQFTTDEAKRRTAMQQGLNQMQKQAVAQIQQMQQDYDKITLQLKMVPTQMAQAQVTNYDQKVTQLRLDCHTQALQIVQKRQADDMAKIAKSSYSIGTLNNIVKTLGMTDEQRYELQAMYYEKKCLNDSAYITHVNLAAKTAKIARQAIAAQRDGLIQQQSRLITSTNTAMQQAALDRNQAYQQAATEEQAARQAYVTQMGSLQQQMATVQSSTAAKIAALNNQSQLLDSQIQQKQSYLAVKQGFVKAAQDARRNQDYSKDQASKVDDGVGKTISTGSDATTKCGCNSSDSSKRQEDQCSELSQFYDSAGIEWLGKNPEDNGGGADGKKARVPAAQPTTILGNPQVDPNDPADDPNGTNNQWRSTPAPDDWSDPTVVH